MEFSAERTREKLPVPYLEILPEEVDISCGRQLFIDDFLIAESNLKRVWHTARAYSGNPVLTPETEIERDGEEAPLACPFNDGVWYDPEDGLYKMFYHAGWFYGTALALSRDGIQWERPDFGIAGHTNLVIPPREGYRRDGCLVWLDENAVRKEERWKMFLFQRIPGGEKRELLTSGDGIHWTFRADAGPCGDNSSFYYDPFRGKWVFSIRTSWPVRIRSFYERTDFSDVPWTADQVIPWAWSDVSDQPDPQTGEIPQLYDLNAAAYESILLGVFAVFYGEPNEVCSAKGVPKTIDLHFAFSRDGFHWQRPEERKPFLACSRIPGHWDRGYLHAAGGICLVFQEELRFYYSGWSGKSRLKPGECGAHPTALAMYAGGSTGFATLRRDGFASMRAEREGELRTPLLRGIRRRLFVNFTGKKIRAELLDRDGKSIPGYSLAESVPFCGDSTKRMLSWRDRKELPELPVQIRFVLEEGDFYSFWTSDFSSGESLGYLAAGSADYQSQRDLGRRGDLHS